MTKSYFKTGEQIRRIRTELGLQQKDILRILKDEYNLSISPARYSNYELDNRQMPFDLLKKVANILGTNTNELLGITVTPASSDDTLSAEPIVLTIHDTIVAKRLKKKYPIYSYLLSIGNTLEFVNDDPVSFGIKSPTEEIITITEKELATLDKNTRGFVEYELFKISQK